MSKRSHLKDQEFARKIVKTLEELPKDGPEPSFLMTDRTHFQILVDEIRGVVATKNADEAPNELRDIKDYAEELIREADSLSLEEKELVMEEILRRRRNGQSS